MAAALQVFCEPKSDWDMARCQDQWAFRATKGGFLAAVSDGATEACLSRLWASHLVQAGISGLPLLCSWGRMAWEPRLLGLANAWRETAEAILPEPRRWFSTEALLRGSHATLLEVYVQDDHWTARAVGDSCLLVLREAHIQRSFPLQAAADFGSSPALLSTLAGAVPQRGVRRAHGRLRAGDILFLATDALACHLLARGDAAELVACLVGEDAQHCFQEWVWAQRGARRMRDDDTTLLIYRHQP